LTTEAVAAPLIVSVPCTGGHIAQAFLAFYAQDDKRSCHSAFSARTQVYQKRLLMPLSRQVIHDITLWLPNQCILGIEAVSLCHCLQHIADKCI